MRLAFADLLKNHGVPQAVLLDNGRAFASKWLTGGAKNRFRFKIKAEEPQGLLTALGCKIHWAMPYHGQSKPIERAFKDLCESIAKHPFCAGAYTGNSPSAKPENYASKAIEIEAFRTHANRQIALHNAQTGRTGGVCNGRSFDAVYNQSYAQAPITKATPQQQRAFLMAAEKVLAHRDDASVRILGNRFWHKKLAPYAGKHLTVRFDPDAPRDGVQVETPDGRLVCFAPCIAAIGYTDQAAARAHAKAQKQHKKATKEELAAQRTLSAAEVAAGLSTGAPPAEEHTSKIITGVFAQRKSDEEVSQEERENFNRGLENALKQMEAQRQVEGF